jgi:hypothetical protein
VLTAWEKPGQTLEKVLNDEKTLIESAANALTLEPSKAVYDVFMRLVPMHLAIGPTAEPGPKTLIDKKYTELCKCDKGEPDACCGPDVGKWSLRQRLLHPQPYLIPPDLYFKVICCLVEKRYLPAKEALATAESDLANVQSKIKRLKSQLDNGLKSFEKDAKGALPVVVKCCGTELDADEPPSTEAS